jgi:hypothetical protein
MDLPKPVAAKKQNSKKVIPEDELMFWIKNNVDLDGAEIVKIRDGYLWSNGNIERHRLDIFEKYYPNGKTDDFCWTNRIGERSFFLHYNREKKTVTDKTTGRVEEETKVSKKNKLPKLDGISNGSERIGKSFR